MSYLKYCSAILLMFLTLTNCRDDDDPIVTKGDLEYIAYDPTPYNILKPEYFPILEIPSDNPTTAEGIELGRFLFYDPILSADSSMGCFSCHKQELAFTDGGSTSKGIDGIFGRRSSMSLVDIGFHYKGLFWDGRSKSLENQALLPVEDAVELHNNWPEVEKRLKRSTFYPKMFREAFGIGDRKEITKELAAKALAQFQRKIVSSGKSKYDLFLTNQTFLESDESDGLDMFFDRAMPVLPDAECAHCHNEPLFTTNDFFNNGLEPFNSHNLFIDGGLGEFTKDTFDYGKFKAPTLRNIMLTAPYMHDGRFATIKEVIDHYGSGGHASTLRDPLIAAIHLTEEQKNKLISFLETLTDTSVIKDPSLSNPFK